MKRLVQTFAVVIIAAMIAPRASGGILLLDSFTSAITPDGVFGAAATRSVVGFSGGVGFNTSLGEARLTADELETPTFSGMVYNFSPSQALLSKVTLTARNRQSSALSTGLLKIATITSSGTFTLSQTLPGATPTMQTYEFDFAALAGGNMSLQQLKVTWDIPAGASGIRGLAIAQIDLHAVPEPSTYAMAIAGLACGGFSMWRRRKRA